MILSCEHDNKKLKEQKGRAGIVYFCPSCKCVYRVMIVTNDRDCWNKRFPAKVVSLKEVRKKKK